MRPVFILAAFLTAATLYTAAHAEGTAGVTQLRIQAEAGTRNAGRDITIWYPRAAGGTARTVGENRIFTGAAAFADADIDPGQFPLVIFSHGSGSRMDGMAWIAARLAAAGYIVAGTDHRGTTSGDSTPEATPKIWERTGDISEIISQLTTDSRWKQSIDSGRIGILGFSLGGSAALELAGARASLDAYIRYCNDSPRMMDCTWFAGQRGFVNGKEVKVPVLDLRSVDRARFEQSARDRRIKAAILVEPGLAQAFDAASLAEIDIPLAFINLGSPGDIPPQYLSDSLARQVRDATWTQVDGADHFSFLPQCKPDAAAFLKSVGETDPICEPSGKRDRGDIHAGLTDIILERLEHTLKNRR